MSCDVVTGHGGDTVHTWNARLEDELVAAQERLWRSREYARLRAAWPLVPARLIFNWLMGGEGEPFEQYLCSVQRGHSWSYTGTAYGGDDESYHGEGRVYCAHCGADGDAMNTLDSKLFATRTYKWGRIILDAQGRITGAACADRNHGNPRPDPRDTIIAELLAALEAVCAFNEYDSLVDQATDAHLRANAAAAWEQARAVLAKVRK